MPGYQMETTHLFVKPMKYMGNRRDFLTVYLHKKQETVFSFLDERMWCTINLVWCLRKHWHYILFFSPTYFKWISVSYCWKYINTCCLRVKFLRIIQKSNNHGLGNQSFFLKYEEVFCLDSHICIIFSFLGESRMTDSLDIRTVTEESSVWMMSTWSFTGSRNLCKYFMTKKSNFILNWKKGFIALCQVHKIKPTD